MPVLNAKALDIDPKGTAFLKGVLCQSYSPKPLSKETPKFGRTHLQIRLIRRLKELIPDTM